MADLKAHDTRISITKAICIILMVVGHSGMQKGLNDFIYLFHMPAFFFISGFLLKEKYLDNVSLFVKRRIKGTWRPFVKWSLIFLALHNVFTYLHIYDSSYSLNDFLKKIFQIFTLTGSERLLGGFWFLKELLYASLLGFASLFFLRRHATVKLFNNSGGVILTLTFLIAAYLLSIAPFKIPTIGSRTMLAASFYMAGYWFNKQSFSKNSNLFFAIFCLLIVVYVSNFFRGSMSVTGTQIFIYYIVALVGTFGIANIAGLIKGGAEKALDYVGSKTLYILIFHFISFKIVSLLKIWQYDLPIDSLADFPVIELHNTYYCILYSIVGVVVPLIIWQINSRLFSKYNSKDE